MPCAAAAGRSPARPRAPFSAGLRGLRARASVALAQASFPPKTTPSSLRPVSLRAPRVRPRLHEIGLGCAGDARSATPSLVRGDCQRGGKLKFKFEPAGALFTRRFNSHLPLRRLNNARCRMTLAESCSYELALPRSRRRSRHGRSSRRTGDPGSAEALVETCRAFKRRAFKQGAPATFKAKRRRPD